MEFMDMGSLPDCFLYLEIYPLVYLKKEKNNRANKNFINLYKYFYEYFKKLFPL